MRHDNFSVVRTFNVEKLNEILTEHDSIICRDSKLSFAVEIRFINELSGERDFRDKVKIEMIKKILEN